MTERYLHSSFRRYNFRFRKRSVWNISYQWYPFHKNRQANDPCGELFAPRYFYIRCKFEHLNLTRKKLSSNAVDRAFIIHACLPSPTSIKKPRRFGRGKCLTRLIRLITFLLSRPRPCYRSDHPRTALNRNSPKPDHREFCADSCPQWCQRVCCRGG